MEGTEDERGRGDEGEEGGREGGRAGADQLFDFAVPRHRCFDCSHTSFGGVGIAFFVVRDALARRQDSDPPGRGSLSLAHHKSMMQRIHLPHNVFRIFLRKSPSPHNTANS
jgi:hypothetical protein